MDLCGVCSGVSRIEGSQGGVGTVKEAQLSIGGAIVWYCQMLHTLGKGGTAPTAEVAHASAPQTKNIRITARTGMQHMPMGLCMGRSGHLNSL